MNDSQADTDDWSYGHGCGAGSSWGAGYACMKSSELGGIDGYGLGWGFGSGSGYAKHNGNGKGDGDGRGHEDTTGEA